MRQPRYRMMSKSRNSSHYPTSENHEHLVGVLRVNISMLLIVHIHSFSTIVLSLFARLKVRVRAAIAYLPPTIRFRLEHVEGGAVISTCLWMEWPLRLQLNL